VICSDLRWSSAVICGIQADPCPHVCCNDVCHFRPATSKISDFG